MLRKFFRIQLTFGAFLALSVQAQVGEPKGGVLQLSLKQAFERALSSNAELQLAREKSVAADAKKRETFSTLFPTITAELSADTRKDAASNPGAAFNAEPYNFYSAQIVGSQPILRGGSLWNLSSASSKLAEMEHLQAKRVEQDVLYEVLDSYLSTFVLQERKKVYERQVAEQERLLRRARQWSGMGSEARMVVLQFQTQLAAYEAEVLQAGAALSKQSVALLSLVGDREARELRLEGGLDLAQRMTLDPSKLGLPTERPEFRRAEVAVQLAEASRTIGMQTHWPALSLVGALGRAGGVRSDLFDEDFTSWRVGLQLQVPLFSGLSSFAERGRLASEFAQARIVEVQMRDLVVRSRVQAEQDFQSSLVLLEARRKVLDAAREAHRLGTSLYSNGAIPYTQFAEADRRVVEAEVAYNEIRRAHVMNIANMHVAGGRSLRELISQF